jgi:hypothetical protein
MANTTNYNWETPDDTDLVKDGAAAIRTLGSAIDTTVFNNASAAVAKTVVDAKGDLIAGTAADTVARLAVGSNNTVLTADSSTATGLKWAAPGASVPANASATVTTLQTTTSDTYTDLATVGPAVTVTTGTKALVIVSAQMRNDTTNRVCYMSYEVSGATSVSASDQVCLLFKNESSSGSQDLRASAASVVTLTAGSNTFTAKYKVNANTGTFINREIFVINLA